MHLRQPDLLIMLADLSLKTKNEYKNAKKQEIQNTFIKTNQIKLAFNMTWLIEIFRIYQDKQSHDDDDDDDDDDDELFLRNG